MPSSSKAPVKSLFKENYVENKSSEDNDNGDESDLESGKCK